MTERAEHVLHVTEDDSNALHPFPFLMSSESYLVSTKSTPFLQHQMYIQQQMKTHYGSGW